MLIGRIEQKDGWKLNYQSPKAATREVVKPVRTCGSDKISMTKHIFGRETLHDDEGQHF